MIVIIEESDGLGADSLSKGFWIESDHKMF